MLAILNPQKGYMPQIFHNTGKVAITLEELVPEHFPTYDALKKAIRRSEIRGYGVQRLMRGGNERQLLVDFDSLPRQIKESFKDPRVAEHPLEPFYGVSKETTDWFSDYTNKNGQYIEDPIRDKYIINASVLQAAVWLKEARERERLNKMGSLRGVMSSICFDVKTFNPILKKTYGVEHSLPENERRFGEKFNDFINIGYESLINKNLGNKNASVVGSDLISLLNNIFSEPAHKPTYAEVARQYEAFLSGYISVINNITGEEYQPSNFKKVSPNTIYNYLSSWGNRIATHSVRSGDRQKLQAKYKPYHSLNQPEFAGSIISIDDRQPPFEYAKGQRMWFYNAIDLASEAFVCWVYGKTKEGIILDFYRQLVRNCHEWGFSVPAEVECEKSLNSSFVKTFLREGTLFDHVRIEPNNARGKRIEAYYRQLRYNYEKDSVGWLARPFAISESNQASSQLVPYIPYNKLIEERLGDIERWNNTPHSKHPNKTRWEYFIESQNPNIRPTNYRLFLKDLGYKTETSVNLGIIRLQNGEYLLGDNGKIATGDDLVNIMSRIEGRNVDVYWLDNNEGEVFKALVYHGDRLICEAIQKPSYNRAKIEQTPADMDARETMSKYVATIEKFRKVRVSTLDSLTIIKTDKQPENQPKTLFRINGVSSSRLQENDPIKEVNGHEFETINGVEIMPDVPTDDIDSISTDTPFRQSLKDRF